MGGVLEVRGEGTEGGVVLPGKPKFKGVLLGVVGGADGVLAVVADRNSKRVISVPIEDIDTWSEVTSGNN
jgi:hypothetical protein